MGTSVCFPSSISARSTTRVQIKMDDGFGVPQHITTTATNNLVAVALGKRVS